MWPLRWGTAGEGGESEATARSRDELRCLTPRALTRIELRTDQARLVRSCKDTALKEVWIGVGRARDPERYH